MPPTTQINIRRDTAANFTSANPTLALGEIAYETDTRNIKVGDGATAWTALGYINPYRGGTAAAPISNTVLGNDAGAALQSGGTFNTLVGALAGTAVTTGDFNVLVGVNAGSTISTTGTNVAVGTNAMQNAKGSDNVAVGHAALNAHSNGTGNVAIGREALLLNTATNNVAIGFQALDANTTGVRNTAVGKDALGANTNSDNTAVGFEALSLMQSGEFNTAIGSQAGRLLTGSANTVIGGGSLVQQTTGNNNIAIGASTMWSHTTGASATIAIGNEAFGYATTATNCVALGHHAGRLINAGTNCTAATSTILIGQDARPSANSETNQIVIGTAARGNGSNTTTIGNSSTTGTFIPAGNLSVQSGLIETVGTSGNGSQKGIFARNNGSTQSVALVPAAGNDGSPFVGTTTNNQLQIRTNTTTRMTVGTDGNVSIANGNLVMSTAGTGIDFSATSDGTGTMTSELLSDYEEGTFTPTVSGGVTSPTYTAHIGHYTKIGRTVFFRLYIDLSGGTASAATFKISGLPFTSLNTGGAGGAYVTYAVNWLTGIGTAFPRLLIDNSSTDILAYRNDNGNGFNGTDFNGVLGMLFIQGQYFV